MTENTDNTVLMKCEKCGYQEYVPEKELLMLREIYHMKPEDEDTVLYGIGGGRLAEVNETYYLL